MPISKGYRAAKEPEMESLATRVRFGPFNPPKVALFTREDDPHFESEGPGVEAGHTLLDITEVHANKQVEMK